MMDKQNAPIHHLRRHVDSIGAKLNRIEDRIDAMEATQNEAIKELYNIINSMQSARTKNNSSAAIDQATKAVTEFANQLNKLNERIKSR